MTTIFLCQGDSIDVPLVLKNGNTGTNLSGSDISLVFTPRYGGNCYSITCSQGAISGTSITPFSEGGITIPFTSEHTKTDGEFIGNIIVTLLGKRTTYPTVGYINIQIKKALS